MESDCSGSCPGSRHFGLMNPSFKGHLLKVGVSSPRGWHNGILSLGCYSGKSARESGGKDGMGLI